VLCVIVAAVAIYPVRTGSLRATLVLGLFTLWASALFLFWNWMVARILCLSVAVAAGLLALLPVLPVDAAGLRSAYVRNLELYRGTPYVWGGETRLGVDCSGLVRVGLMDAEAQEGLRTHNLVLLRKAASLWWNDCSASALGNEYQGRTRRLFDAADINHIDSTELKPGDMAVTQGGAHILAYIGDRTWIEADPSRMSVITRTTPCTDAYFNMPTEIVRWRIMEPAPPTAEPR
jgi:hypothetical protein